MNQLYEKYRPKRLSQIRGQDKAVKVVGRLAKLGLGGRAIWISGKTGQGKTTLALCAGREIADSFNIVEYDAGSLAKSDVQDIQNSWQSFGWGKGGRAYIFNEAHGLRADVIRAMLVMLEQIPAHVLVVFTTTTENMTLFEDKAIDAKPLLSRCVCLALTSQGIAPVFARLVCGIIIVEGLSGDYCKADLLALCLKLANKTKSNCRAMLQAVGSGAMLA